MKNLKNIVTEILDDRLKFRARQFIRELGLGRYENAKNVLSQNSETEQEEIEEYLSQEVDVKYFHVAKYLFTTNTVDAEKVKKLLGK